MILVILGTHGQPFPRAIRRAAELTEPGEEFVVQHGHTAPLTDVDARWLKWCSRAQLDGLICSARIVLVHGGSGCIMQVLDHGVRPVVLPRLARHGEHVDDHQLQLPGRLERSGRVVVWHDGELPAAALARLEREPLDDSPRRQDLRPVVWAAARTLARHRP